jgi:hypothetical protein
LKEQPPLFNLFLGTILQLFPQNYQFVFALIFLALGLGILLCLFSLLQRLNVSRPLSLLLSLIFTLNPATLLYENILFYEYVLTFVFCLAALSLHRYASTGQLLDISVFFWCLAVASGLRSVFHLFWFLLLAALVLAALPRWRRRTAFALVLPAALVCFIYGKHVFLFGGLVPGGDVFGSTNFAIMSSRFVPPEKLQALIRSGAIAPDVLTTSIYEVQSSPILEKVPLPAATGIATLDERFKSTGKPNWSSLWMTEVGKLYRKDASTVFKTYPYSYLRCVIDNIGRIIQPASLNFPFDGRVNYSNLVILEKPLAVFRAISAGKFGGKLPWFNMVLLPFLAFYGARISLPYLVNSWKNRNFTEDPAALTILFMVFNIIFLCSTVVLLSEADQNRYRVELSSFFALLLGHSLSSFSENLKSMALFRTATKSPLSSSKNSW